MKPLDHQLNRLFKAAAQSPRPLPTEAPFAIESRVLAQWRSGRGAEDELFSLLPLFRGGLALACAIALLAITFSLREPDQGLDEVVIIESVAEMSYLP